MTPNMDHHNQYRIHPTPAAVGAGGYLSLAPQWGGMLPTTTAASTSYIPSPAIAPPPPPPPLPPAQAASAAITANQPPSTQASNPTPRRTLTDTDRRKMCLYHEENPNIKQTEIGGMT